MMLEETPAYRLSGKTGTAEITDTREMAWLVGFVEQGEAVSFYALNMEGETVWEEWPPQQRADLVKRLLQAITVLPPAL
jgi:beta-lactamase class D